MSLDKMLLEKVRSNDITLTLLDLFDKQVHAAGAKELSHALKHNTTLISIVLGYNEIDDAGAKEISHALKHNTT
jgi:hypothetical protein